MNITLNEKAVTSYQEAFNYIFPTATLFTCPCTMATDGKVSLNGVEAGNLGVAAPAKVVWGIDTTDPASYCIWCTDTGGTGVVLAPNGMPFVYDKDGTSGTGMWKSPTGISERLNITTMGRAFEGIVLPLWTMGTESSSYDLQYPDIYVATYSTNLKPDIGYKLDTEKAEYEAFSMVPGSVNAGYTPAVLFCYKRKDFE